MIQIQNGTATPWNIAVYTFTEVDMGDVTITLTLALPADVDPQFSTSMYVEYKGEQFFLSTINPQTTKDITNLQYQYALVFNSQRNDLKIRMVRDLVALTSGQYVSQGLVFSQNLGLSDFFKLLQLNLTDCFGYIGNTNTPKWFIDVATNFINTIDKDWAAVNNPALDVANSVEISISNSFIWDLLLKTYEYYGIRWQIISVAGGMAIRVGYPSDEIVQVFQYGGDTGLTKITRELTTNKVVNRLRGQGGTRNVPTNYFTSRYSNFPPDPNPLNGLDLVWKGDYNDTATYAKNEAVFVGETPEFLPYYSLVDGNCGQDPNTAATFWCIVPDNMISIKNVMPKCFRDSIIAGTTLIDYVQDDALVAANGIIEDGLAENDAIYPSIETVYVAGLGRIDEIVYAEKTFFDDPEYRSGITIIGATSTAWTYSSFTSDATDAVVVTESDTFTIDAIPDIAAILNLTYIDQYTNTVAPTLSADNSYKYEFNSVINNNLTAIVVYGQPMKISVMAELVKVSDMSVVGSYSMDITQLDTSIDISFTNLEKTQYFIRVTSTSNGNLFSDIGKTTVPIKWAAVGLLSGVTNVTGIYKPTFDIWVKDIQFDLTEMMTLDGVTSPKYAGTDAGTISFTTGALAGYDFVILENGGVFAVVEDASKQLINNQCVIGGVLTTNTVQSKYRITLIKNDTEYQAEGLMIPNVSVQAYPNSDDVAPIYGDKFTIIDIQMPQSYVELAEQRVQDYLTAQLNLAKIDDPTYTMEILTSFIAINNAPESDGKTIEDKLRAGNMVRIADDRLIIGDNLQYINSITIDYKDLLPKYTVVITDKLTVNGSAVSRIQAQIDALYTGQYSNAESNEMSIANLDNRYLQKTIADTAYQPITFKRGAIVSDLSTEDFEQGQFSGSGGGIYKDISGATVAEVDKLIVRKTATFNEIIINQILFQGGIVIYSCANMEVLTVSNLGTLWTICFDMKGGSVQNQFAVGDIIRCQQWTSGTQTKYYMSVVTAIGVDFIVIDSANSDGSVAPAVKDIIVQFGNVSDVTRQSAIEINVLAGGVQTFYQGLCDFTTTNKNAVDIGMVLDTDSVWKNMMRVYGDAYIGARDLSTYVKYTQGVPNTDPSLVIKPLLEIKAKVNFLAADGTYKNVADMPVPADLSYLTDAIKGSATVDGGLVLTDVLAVTDIAGNVMGGMSGLVASLFRLWLGNADPTLANFSVDKDGNMIASNAVLNGTINATGGKIGGLSIIGETLISDSIELSESPVDLLSALLNPDTITIERQASWDSGLVNADPVNFIVNAIASTQDFTLAHTSSICVHVENESHDDSNNSLYVACVQIIDGNGYIAYNNSLSFGYGVMNGFSFTQSLPAGTYHILSTLKISNNIDCHGVNGRTSIWGAAPVTGLDDPNIYASGYIFKTKIGSDGLYSFWDDLTYLYYSKIQGLKSKGAKLFLNDSAQISIDAASAPTAIIDNADRYSSFILRYSDTDTVSYTVNLPDPSDLEINTTDFSLKILIAQTFGQNINIYPKANSVLVDENGNHNSYIQMSTGDSVEFQAVLEGTTMCYFRIRTTGCSPH